MTKARRSPELVSRVNR